jgi:hypothetical protein
MQILFMLNLLDKTSKFRYHRHIYNCWIGNDVLLTYVLNV